MSYLCEYKNYRSNNFKQKHHEEKIHLRRLRLHL